MRIRTAVLPVVVAPLLMASSCGEDPCKDVPQLDAEQRQAAVDLLALDDRFEIEYEVNDNTDCELDENGNFGQEED